MCLLYLNSKGSAASPSPSRKRGDGEDVDIDVAGQGKERREGSFVDVLARLHPRSRACVLSLGFTVDALYTARALLLPIFVFARAAGYRLS